MDPLLVTLGCTIAKSSTAPARLVEDRILGQQGRDALSRMPFPLTCKLKVESEFRVHTDISRSRHTP